MERSVEVGLARTWMLYVVLLGGCAMHQQKPVLPVEETVQRDQLIIYSDFRLPRHHRLVEELVAQRSDLANLLDLPLSDEPIHVYLFDSAAPYEAFFQENYPQLPSRRAFFVESDTRLTVYAHWGDRVAEDLRHEVAHGYLHSVIPNLPLWLDEGLAEYFEVPRGHNGLNRPHVQLLMELYDRGNWTPDLAGLESAVSAGDLAQLAYAESWAWVHWMLESDPELIALLQNYMARLRVTGEAPPLSKFVRHKTIASERALVRHLQSLMPPP